MLSPSLQQTTTLLPFVCRHDFIRFLSTSSYLCGINRPKLEAERSARMITKIMTGAKRVAVKKIDQTHQPSKLLADFGFIHKKTTSITGYKLGSGRQSRRTDMLNNLFVEQITSLLATEEVAPGFLGLGIQISKVKITPDFSAVNVYWCASGTETDEKIENLLRASSGHLRHQLSQLRVLGIVPPINFLKDTTFSKFQEVETLLASMKETAATNSDQIASDNEENFESAELSANLSENFEEKQAFAQMDVDFAMSHEILGVKHDLIMNQIKISLEKKSEKKRAQERNLANISAARVEIGNSENEGVHGQEIGELEHEVMDHRKRQAEFLKYLKKQQVEKDKNLRSMSVQAYDKKFYESLREERMKTQLRNRLDELDGLFNAFNNSDVEEDYNKYDDEHEKFYESLRENFK